MASKIFWLFLVMLLSISTFGLWMCCFMFISTASLIAGFVVTSCSKQNLRLHINFIPACYNSNERNSFLFLGIPKVLMEMQSPSKIPKHDQRLTGSIEIDGPLREIMYYILRDFIHSWYKDVSTNEDFINGFNEMCKSVINNFSKSSKDVNWISFITQKVVEDFTTHLRLYRHAEIMFRKQQKERNEIFTSIESAFFQLETEMENICRESVCTTSESEREYLQSISDVILYLLLPPEDFNNKILKHFLREVLLGSLFQPLLLQFSDPDIINQNLIYMCKDHLVSSKALLSVLRRTDSKEELEAFHEIAKHEIKVRNSKDTGDKDEMKKYIKSISFVQSIALQRYERLSGHSKHAETDSTEFYLNLDVTDSIIPDKKKKLVSLPFDVILNNNIALHYFTQYLASMDAEGYVFLYHNIEGFRTTVGMMQTDGVIQDGLIASEKLRNLAMQIFDSYLGANATTKVHMDETLLRKLVSRIKTEAITETFFDEVQEKVYDVLENEFYLTGFKDSKQYVKLLAELDLLHDLSSSCDLDSLSSSKSEEEERFNCDTVVPTDEEMLNDLLTTEISSNHYEFPEISSGALVAETKEIGTLFAEVHSTGITHHAGRTFAVYAISVNHFKNEDVEEKWFVVRRYSEFYDFHAAVVQKYPILSAFNFPSKKPFNNLTRQLMEKRRHMLNAFIQFLLSPDILDTCDGLKFMVYNFLQPNMSEKGKKSFVRSVGTFVNPIKTSVKTVGHIVRLVPDTFFELKDGFMKTFFKSGDGDNSDSVADSKPFPLKDPRTDDIPFRIILLLMDEVFNLRNKDLWFRRRIMALLRQIIKTMQGGAINRKIKEYVQGLTSAAQIAEWLKLLSKTIWPDGLLAGPSQERDQNTKMRTRIVAKMLLFCAIPDELKHIIGYETSFKGAMLIFNMFQHPPLNRRLLFVILESFLVVLFPNHKFPELFQKLHSLSPKINHSRSSSVEKSRKNSFFAHETQIPEIKEELVSLVPSQSNIKASKESKNKLSLQCLSQQNLSSPKQKRRKKSAERAVFYTDWQENEDTVILPLNR